MLWDKCAVPCFTLPSCLCHLLVAESPEDQLAGGKGAANTEDFRLFNSWGIHGEYIHIYISILLILSHPSSSIRMLKDKEKQRKKTAGRVECGTHGARRDCAMPRRETTLTVAWRPASSSTGIPRLPQTNSHNSHYLQSWRKHCSFLRDFNQATAWLNNVV